MNRNLKVVYHGPIHIRQTGNDTTITPLTDAAELKRLEGKYGAKTAEGCSVSPVFDGDGKVIACECNNEGCNDECVLVQDREGDELKCWCYCSGPA